MEHCSEIRSLFVVSRFQIRLSKNTNDHCIVLHVMYGQIFPAKDKLLRILSDCFRKEKKQWVADGIPFALYRTIKSQSRRKKISEGGS